MAEGRMPNLEARGRATSMDRAPGGWLSSVLAETRELRTAVTETLFYKAAQLLGDLEAQHHQS